MHWEGGIMISIISIFLLDSVQDLVLIASSDLSLLFLSVMGSYGVWGMGDFTDRRRKWHASCA